MLDIEGIERATLAAVPPEQLEERAGWLLGLDRGTVGRAHSAAPLRHVAPAAADLAAIEARYAAFGLSACLRVPELPAFDALRDHLRAAGYASAKPTLVQVAALKDVAVAPGLATKIVLEASPGRQWEEVFLGAGFDPVDGASRLGILRRARDSVFASVRRGGRTVAVGSACFGHGWCGVHGMRTAPDARRQGLAAAILAELAGEARSRGLANLFLQVEHNNAAAQSVYRRLGFATA